MTLPVALVCHSDARFVACLARSLAAQHIAAVAVPATSLVRAAKLLDVALVIAEQASATKIAAELGRELPTTAVLVVCDDVGGGRDGWGGDPETGGLVEAVVHYVALCHGPPSDQLPEVDVEWVTPRSAA